MIQSLFDLEIPDFPKVLECDKWMLRIWKNYSVCTMINDEVFSIEHITHLSKEGYGCTKFAIHVDKDICALEEERRRFERLSFGEPIERNISYFTDCYEDIIYISDNPEELKSIATALFISECRQLRITDEE